MTLDTPSLTTSPRGAGVPSSSSSIPSATPLGTWGLVNSMGIFQAYWQEHQLTSYSSKAIGWIASLNVFLNLFLGVQIGPLFDRCEWCSQHFVAFLFLVTTRGVIDDKASFITSARNLLFDHRSDKDDVDGPHWILAVGSNGYVLALFLMAQCSQYWRFMLCYGVLACVSSSMLSTTSVSVIAHWFDTKRGQASGIVFIGSSLGGVVIPLAMQPMLRKLGWAWSIHIVAFIILFLSLVGNLCIRGPLPKKQRGGTIDLKCFRDFRFIWATIGIASTGPLLAYIYAAGS
ncbi:MAG: hypothetical protein M1818_002877 [Claussenomyces sp. TS43310]|nr:MAG: hypothetical protein M1818_002877 [Claussenomyces sp. TS43310]